MKRLHSVVDATWLAMLALYIIGGAAIVPFHGDESSKIYIGRDYYYLFLLNDREKLSHQSKRTASADGYRANLASGSISNMIYGWLAASHGYAISDLNDDWHWGLDYNANVASKRLPATQLLRSARLASAAQLAAATALLYVFARMLINRPPALLASLLFASQPSLLLNGRRALQEGSHMLGAMLVLVTGAWLLRQGKWWQFALLGICSGWAIAAKHTSAFQVALVFLVLLALFLYQNYQRLEARKTDKKQFMRYFAGILLAGALTLLVFYLLNPGWWGAPVETARAALSERSALLQRQAGVYGGYQSFGQQAKGFFRFVFSAEIQYFEDPQWADFAEISQQIQLYEASGWAGTLFGGTVSAGLVMSVLAAAGIMLLARAGDICWRKRAFILAWGSGIAAIVFALTPLPWARYYLPVLPFTLLMAAYAIASAAQATWKRLAERRHTEERRLSP